MTEGLQISESPIKNMSKNEKGFCEDESCKCNCHEGSSFRRGNEKRQYC